METRVVNLELEVTEFKPQKLIEQYFQKTTDCNKKYFTNLKSVSCVGCCSTKVKETFKKNEMKYIVCADCMTYYVSERPEQDVLQKYFIESESRVFWLKELMKATHDQRKKKIFEPMIDWIASYIPEVLTSKASVLEIQPHHWGLIECAQNLNWKILKPMFDINLSSISNLNQHIVREESSETFDAICLLDTLGRVFSPQNLFETVTNRLNKGGYCFVSTILSSGLEMMLLKDSSDTLTAPDRLNVLSYEAITKLAEKNKFEVVEFSTPGVLDLKIIEGMLKSNKAIIPQFFEYMISIRKDQEMLKAFQEFLQMYRLSSQAHLVLRKKA